MPFGDGILSAKTPILKKAFSFIEEFTIDGGLIVTPWIEREGGFMLDVWDWTECWCLDPPKLAEIIAPPGFVPENGR
jgi:hypothetical protein